FQLCHFTIETFHLGEPNAETGDRLSPSTSTGVHETADNEPRGGEVEDGGHEDEDQREEREGFMVDEEGDVQPRGGCEEDGHHENEWEMEREAFMVEPRGG
ncbi:hypothetical protein A2U01_0059034, partial [Trifolium medium]|nr:hypothetical protein [Trifolium medium]